MKELSIFYQYEDDQEQYQIPLNNYIEQNDIQDFEVEMIITILNHQQIEFDRNTVKVYNKESEEWEDLEHFYVQVEDLLEDDGCYSYENGIRLQLQRVQQYQYEDQIQQQQQLQQQQNQQNQPFQSDQFSQQIQQTLGEIIQNMTNMQNDQQYLYQVFAQTQEDNRQIYFQIQYQYSELKSEIEQNLTNLTKQISQISDLSKNASRIITGGGTQTNRTNNLVNMFGIDPSPNAKPVNMFVDILGDNENDQGSNNQEEPNFFGEIETSNNNPFMSINNKITTNETHDNQSMFSIPTNVKAPSDSKSISLINIIEPKQDSLITTDQTVMKSPISMFRPKGSQMQNPGNLIPPTTPIMRPTSNTFQMKGGLNSFNSNLIKMAIMYSEPLVQKKNQFIFAAGEPVEYEQEILQLTRYFQKCKNNVEINIRVANLDNLEEEIINSQILHISCHGDFHKEYQKYYLQFEEKNCELKCVTTEQFKTLLQNKKERPKLTFVNACHSEEVGQIFLNSGIPFVVAVQSNLKIQDKAAQIFSNSFYMGLMQGYSIKLAFKSAKDALVAKHHQACYTCCCAHKHSDTCQWQTYAMDHGYQEAHKLHEDFACDCYNPSRQDNLIKNPIYHKKNCNKIMGFFQEIDDQNKIDEMFMLANNQPFYGCCCQDESTPHDESAKFKLLCINDTLDYQFNFEKGEMCIKQNFDMYNSQFRSQFKLFGRNREMYEIFNSLNDCNHNSQFVVVYGERGSGLTSISKKAARHLKEREVVNEIIIEDFENVDRGISKFKTKLKKFKNGREGTQPFYTLMILDNCDDLVNKNLDDFTKQLSDTSLNVKFIIITHFKPNLKFNESVINYVELKPLDKKVAFEIISHHIGNQLRTLELDQNFDNKPIFPKFVMEIVQSIKNGSNLSDLLVSQDPLDILMKKIKENPPKYEMLLVICLFPHGVSVEDLKYLASKNKIPQNWENIMLELTSKESVDPNLTALMNESDSAESSDNLEPNSARSIPDSKNMLTSHSEHHFKIGQYFWMSVSKNELNFISFKIKKNIPRWLYSKEEYSIDLLQKEVLILEYLSYFAKKMLNSIKIERYSKIKMVDYSSIVDYGIFRVGFSQDWFEDEDNQPSLSSTPTPSLNRCYSDNFEEHLFKKFRKNLENLFKLHEQNLYVYLKKEDLMNLIRFMNSSYCSEKKVLKEVLKDLCVDIPSIHKLLDHKEDALEQCEKAISILDELIKYPDNMPFLLAKQKILFIQANICFDQFDFQTKNQDDFSNLLKSYRSVNDGIESLENHPEFQEQKNILTIMKAEKVFLITYTIKILIEQKLSKYIDESYDLSFIIDLVNLINPKRRQDNYQLLKEVCRYLIDQLNLYPSDLQRIDGNNIIVQSKENGSILNIVKSTDYLQERTSANLEVLIAKIKFVRTCIEGFYYYGDYNEEYIESLQESIQVFFTYSLNELKEQCIKQFAKQFLKNKTILKNERGEPLSCFNRLETEIVRAVKADIKENNSQNIKGTFEKVYSELQKQDSRDYKITIQTNV